MLVTLFGMVIPVSVAQGVLNGNEEASKKVLSGMVVIVLPERSR